MSSDLDQVIISEMRIYAKIGLTPEERAYKQPIVIDLRLGVPQWRSSNAKGDLSQSICYSSAKQRVEDLITGKEWVLVEELAEETARLLFREFPRLMEAAVEVRKFVVPETNWAGVRMVRRRESFENLR